MKGSRTLFSRKNREFPPTLSSQEREYGRKLFWKFFTLNGISVAFLMENVLIIYAIRNGVSDPMVAVLASFLHLTMPFMIFGKRAVAHLGAARTWGLGWFIRYLFASFMILGPFISHAASQYVVTAVILTSSFGFALFRSMGVVGSTPLEGEVTTPDNRGNFLSGNLLRVNATQILATLMLILITRITDDLWVYQMVIAAACIIGMYASTVIGKIPESIVPKISAQIPLKKAFSNLWSDIRARRLLFAWSAGVVSFTMVIPFMMIGVKSGYGVSDYTALSFSLILLVGGIVSSLVNGIIADQVGPRPILLMNTAGLLVSAGFWAAAPTEFYPLLVGFVFFLSGYCKYGILIGLSHYFLSAVGDSDRVGSILFIRVLSGTMAGLTGSVLGGGLLSFFEIAGISGMDTYRFFFRIIFFLLLAMIIIVKSLEKLDEWPIKNILGMLVSPRDMYALYVLRRLRSNSGSRHDTKTVQRLGAIGSLISESELCQQLDSPLLTVRVNALQALGRIPFGKSTEDAVINQLVCGEFTSAWVAAEILGDHTVHRAIKYLRRGLTSQDQFLQGKCMVALVRLSDEESYGQIIALFESSSNPRIIIHGANALSMMKGTDHLAQILKKSLQPDIPSPVVDEVLTAAASAAGVRGRFYQFLQQFNRNRDMGISELISDLDVQFFKADDMNVLLGGIHEEKHLKFFTRILEKRSMSSKSRAAISIREVLQDNAESELPIKTAFCMALILTASGGEAVPAAGEVY